MSNPLLARGQPNRHLHIAMADVALAIAATGVWQGVFRIPMQDRLPAWTWPVAALLFALSGAAAYRRHRTTRRR